MTNLEIVRVGLIEVRVGDGQRDAHRHVGGPLTGGHVQHT